jgi:hypothetical protein
LSFEEWHKNTRSFRLSLLFMAVWRRLAQLITCD